MVAPPQQRRTRRRADRRRVEPRVLQPVRRQPLDRRCRTRAPERRRRPETDVVDQHDQHVRRSLRRSQRANRRERRICTLRVVHDEPGIAAIRDRQHRPGRVRGGSQQSTPSRQRSRSPYHAWALAAERHHVHTAAPQSVRPCDTLGRRRAEPGPFRRVARTRVARCPGRGTRRRFRSEFRLPCECDVAASQFGFPAGGTLRDSSQQTRGGRARCAARQSCRRIRRSTGEGRRCSPKRDGRGRKRTSSPSPPSTWTMPSRSLYHATLRSTSVTVKAT